MKKHRKQGVFVNGEKSLVDVPVDDKLYKADNREEYQRSRSKKKHVSLDAIILASKSVDVMEAYEEAQLMECLLEAIQGLSETERLLVECIYYKRLTSRETATVLKTSQSTVVRRNREIIEKLRYSLVDWK